MPRKKKPKKKVKRKRPAKRRKRKKQTSKRNSKQVLISRAVKVREITVRYGGVIRTGSYENRRVSYEITADCPRGVSPDAAFDYLQSLGESQFYRAQLRAIEGLPAEMRDELGDVSRLSPQEAAQKIGDFFGAYKRQKKFTPQQKNQRIKELQDELKEIASKIRAENKRLQKIKKVESEDLTVRAALIERQKTIKKELKALRRP